MRTLHPQETHYVHGAGCAPFAYDAQTLVDGGIRWSAKGLLWGSAFTAYAITSDPVTIILCGLVAGPCLAYIGALSIAATGFIIDSYGTNCFATDNVTLMGA